jgi:hypothetical protein
VSYLALGDISSSLTDMLPYSVLLSMELCMATCYHKMDTKYYPDAMALYKKIIEQHSDNIPAKNVSI